MGGPVRIDPWRHDDYRFENNIFWQDDNHPDAVIKRILNKEMEKGQHKNSIIDDPLFMDPPGGNFSLRKDSPALKIGFKPIDISNVGPRFQACRPESYDKFSKRYKIDYHPSRATLQTSLQALKQWKLAEKIQGHPEWKIKRLPHIDNPEQIKALLKHCRPLYAKIFHLDYEAAEIRLVASGDNLAMHAVIRDKQITTAKLPWDGSCLILFGSMPNSKTVSQVNLQPPKAGKAVVATKLNQDSCVPASEIKSIYSLLPDGYELCTLVPFSSLSIDGNPKTFLMELLVITALSETGPHQSVIVFGGACNGIHNTNHGLIVVDK